MSRARDEADAMRPAQCGDILGLNVMRGEWDRVEEQAEAAGLLTPPSAALNPPSSDSSPAGWC
jgi:hypothetical protein